MTADFKMRADEDAERELEDPRAAGGSQCGKIGGMKLGDIPSILECPFRKQYKAIRRVMDSCGGRFGGGHVLALTPHARPK